MTSDGLTANGAIIYSDTDADPAADRSAYERGDSKTVVSDGSAVSYGPGRAHGAAEREGQRS